MKLRLIILIFFSIALVCISSVEAQERKIVDVHLHALPTNFLPADWDTLAATKRPGSNQALIQQTINQLEHYHIEKAVTSGEPELLAQYEQAASDRIIRSEWIPWDIKGDSLRTYIESLPRWYEQERFQVIGEVLTQYSGIAPTDPILDPLWAFAEKEGVPVGIHINEIEATCPESFSKGCAPLAMRPVLSEYSNLKVYIMHGGYPHLEDMIELLDAYSQVYVGATFSPMNPEEQRRYLKGLVEAGYADRIMFGSDQMVWPEFIGYYVRAIENAEFLTEKQKNAIFYENAARFFEFDS